MSMNNQLERETAMLPYRTTGAQGEVDYPLSTGYEDLQLPMQQYPMPQRYPYYDFDHTLPLRPIDTTRIFHQSYPWSGHSYHYTSTDDSMSSAGGSDSPDDMYLDYDYLDAYSPAPLFFAEAPRRSSTSDTMSQTSSLDMSPITPATEIDSLMLAIQAKQPAPTSHPATTTTATTTTNTSSATSSPTKNTRAKKHFCPHPFCAKAFTQKTHLDIHVRSHTGEKPFRCREPSCGQTFSQQGNLRTHERRHTGERPYVCERCGKGFAQRGNWRAHQLAGVCGGNGNGLEAAAEFAGVGKARGKGGRGRFECKLGGCGENGGKWFTQLGNLKSHQNKYHWETLRGLRERFARVADGNYEFEMLHLGREERELWEYFQGLYRNCNKGIKGRGKGRRVDIVRREADRSSLPREEWGTDVVVDLQGEDRMF